MIIYLLIAFVLVWLVIFAIYAFNTWRAKRDQARMRQDTEFKVWLDRVNAQLVQYGANDKARALEDWKIDFDAGVSPNQAAKNHLGGIRSSDAGLADTE